MAAPIALLVAAATHAASLPLPTAAQLRWMQDEVTGMGSYNMGTYEGCGIGAYVMEGHAHTPPGHEFISLPKGSAFNPTALNVTQWMDALRSAGAKHAVLTLSHGCGYTLYPSRTSFPEFNFTYDYGIRQSPYKGGQGDIAREFVDACRKAGIRPGFYNGAVNNAYLNVVRGVVGKEPTAEGQRIVTQEQYEQILMANLRQQWTDYGELAEVWFDGGYPAALGDNITALLRELQPNAIAYQGPVGYPNVVRWAGTESAHPGYPMWSTAKSSQDEGPGSADAPVFVPAESDTCFQTPPAGAELAAGSGVEGPYPGCWFYNPRYVAKSVTELMSEYYDTVGANTFLMLGWDPRPEGDIDPAHLTRFREFGLKRAECMTPLVVVNTSAVQPSGGVVSYPVSLPQGAVVGMILVSENLAFGQRVRSFTVGAGGTVLAHGTSIGNRRIVRLSKPVSMQSLVINYQSVGEPIFSAVTLHATCDTKL